MSNRDADILRGTLHRSRRTRRKADPPRDLTCALIALGLIVFGGFTLGWLLFALATGGF